ncbi:MAG: hypothetical protein AMXMBFR33_73070 [Candidatus Xenobia bacterium]
MVTEAAAATDAPERSAPEERRLSQGSTDVVVTVSWGAVEGSPGGDERAGCRQRGVAPSEAIMPTAWRLAARGALIQG